MGHPTFLPGSKLLDKYLIERFLAQGGFAEVYLAQHLFLKVPRALKIVTHQFHQGKTRQLKRVIERFRLEAQLGAQFSHAEGIVRVYDFEPDPSGNLYVLVMEYMPGGSLKEKIRAAPSGLPVAEVVRIARDAAEGLALLHQRGLVHRDIKPSNLLFDAQGRAKIADLGIVQMPDHRTRMGQHMGKSHPGTPMYMSPEQENSSAPLTPASDIYSLGLVLFEALTRRNPKMLRPGVRVREFREDVPLWLDALLARMLSHSPEERPWDGAELLKWLQRSAPPGHSYTVSYTATEDTNQTDLGTEHGLDFENDYEERGQLQGSPPAAPPMPDSPLVPKTLTPVQKDLPSTATRPPVTPPTPTIRPHRTLRASGPVHVLLAWNDWLIVSTDRSIDVWKPSSKDPAFRLYGHGGSVTGLVALPEKRDYPAFLSAGDDGRLLHWRLPKNQPVRVFTPAPRGLRSLALRPRDTTSEAIHVMGVDFQSYVYLWRMSNPDLIWHVQAGKAQPVGLKWLDVKHWILAENQGRLTVWKETHPIRKWRYPGAWSSMDAHGDKAILGDEAGYLWLVDLRTGKILMRWHAHKDRVSRVVFVKEGFLSLGWDARVCLWDAQGHRFRVIVLPAIPLSATLSAQGLWVGCHDGSVFLFTEIKF